MLLLCGVGEQFKSSGAADMSVGHRRGADECKGRQSAGGYHGPYICPVNSLQALEILYFCTYRIAHPEVCIEPTS